MDTPSSEESGYQSRPRSAATRKTDSSPPDERREKNKDQSATKRFSALSKPWLLTAVLLTALVIYTLLGALIFLLVEGSYERNHVQKLQELRKNILGEFTKLAIENKDLTNPPTWDKYIKAALEALKKWEKDIFAVFNSHQRVRDGQKFGDDELGWKFWNCVFFSMNIYTALGYGHIVPATTAGRALVIGYALIGIPLFLLVLSNLGKFLARILKIIYGATCRRCVLARRRQRATDSGDHIQKDEEFTLPIILALSVFFIAVIVGSVIFYCVEHEWSFFDAFYFVYFSMLTVGFGDFLPTSPGMVIFTVVYLILGLALGAMCVEAIRQYMQARVAEATKQLVAKFRQREKG